MIKYSPFVLFLIVTFSAKIYSQSDEEQTLQTVVEEETLAFTKMAFSEVAQKFWLLDDKTRSYVTISDGTQIFADKEEILSNTSVPPEGHATFRKSNYRFIIRENMASATYDQEVVIAETGDKMRSHEMHIFQKVNGVWKIHLTSVHLDNP